MTKGRTGSHTRSPVLGSVLRRIWHPRLLFLLAVFFAALGAGGAWGIWRNICAGDRCPSIAEIRTFQPEQTSQILSEDGHLIGQFGTERRTPVSIHAVPAYVPEAIIAIEDKRFYHHGAFDPRGIARAALGVLIGRNFGGGSTIEQELARNMFEQRIGFSRTLTRKVKELQVAMELTHAYTKEQILEAYMNQIYMGRAGYGFQSAARYYLGKNLQDVNPAEAALLAAILNLPRAYDPFRHPASALARRNLVLTKMAQQGYLTKAAAERWKAYPLPTQQPGQDSGSVAPYFLEWVRQILESRFGEGIYRNGYKVYTTLNVGMQRAARAAMRAGWAAVESDSDFDHPRYAQFDTVRSFPGQTPYLQGAFVALDPATGQVRALIGGRNFEQSEFDRARLAERQAGSSFKAFVYSAAIASGIPASQVLVDGPVVYKEANGKDWRPHDFEPYFQGPLTLREGFYESVNTIAIKLGWQEVGIQSVIQMARRMGITTPIQRVPSTMIGSAGVIPLQMAEAYSTFATLGTRVRPFPIVRVEDAQGNVVWQPKPERTQVIDSMVARIMVSMMQDVVNVPDRPDHPGGTGQYAIRVRSGLPSEVPAAGKTGTTNDGTNVWFDGVTPNLVAVVWFGMDRPIPIFKVGPGRRQATGGGLAAPVWGDFMKRVYYGVPGNWDTLRVADGTAATRGTKAADSAQAKPLLPIPNPWPIPAGLDEELVDRKTGQLASKWCPKSDQYMEYYIPGTAPTEFCDRSSDRRFRQAGGMRP